jgi:hypothetical protein
VTPSLVILTGASGAGKTALARHFLKHHAELCDVFFFDSVGVPSLEVMEAEYGSPEAWQRAMTLQWIARIQPILSGDRPVLFEGQMRIAFLQEALSAQQVSGAHIVLVDCDDAVRTERLHLDRLQPELANPTMMNWARYLRREAVETGAEILDTGVLSFEDCVARVNLLLFGAAR